MMRPQPAYRGDGRYVFVSYSHEDDAVVGPEIADLQRFGFNVWWDEGISPGSAWRTEVVKAIRGASLIVFFVTPQSVRSSQAVREVTFGLDEHHRPVLAVHLEPTVLSDALALTLSDRQAILKHELEPDDYQRKLATSVATYLEQPVPELGSSRVSFGRRRRRQAWLPVLTFLLGGALTGGLGWSIADRDSGRPVSQPVTRSTIELDPLAPLAAGGPPPTNGYHVPGVALSSDGRYLAYVGETNEGRMLILRDLARGEFERLAGTEGATHPFFSPDGQWLGFLTDNSVKKVPVSGGAPIPIASIAIPTFARWPTGDAIYVSDNNAKLLRVSATDGTSLSLENTHFTTDVLPGVNHVLESDFARAGSRPGNGKIVAVDLSSGERVDLIDNGYAGFYVPTGHIVFARGSDLYAVAFDASTLRVLGDAKRVVSDVATESAFESVQAAVSSNGLFVYATGGDSSVAAFQWIDRSGKAEPLAAPPGSYVTFDLAPDDRSLAVQVADVADYLWIYDLETETGRKIATPWPINQPIWSPDGQRVLVSGITSNGVSLGIVDTASAGRLETLKGADGRASFWTSDGHVVFKRRGISVLAPGTRNPEQIVDELRAWGAEASPDGRWIAYTSFLTGRSEVRIRLLTDPRIDRQVSVDGATEPVWCRSCDEVFFRAGHRWYATTVQSEPELTVAPPRLVFVAPGFVDTLDRSYDVSRDGKRLLILTRVHEPTRTKLTLVTNWFAELERLVPREPAAP